MLLEMTEFEIYLDSIVDLYNHFFLYTLNLPSLIFLEHNLFEKTFKREVENNGK